MSTKTVSNRLKETGDRYRHVFTSQAIIEAAEAALRISGPGRATGAASVQIAIFRQTGLRPTREAVRAALQATDPFAVQARQERILPRRTYDVLESMLLWHIDSKSLLDTRCISTLPQVHHNRAQWLKPLDM